MTLLRWILLPPAILLALALAVANRQSVTFSLDPFNPAEPALGFELPLALIVLGGMFVGILIGGLAAWGQARRKQALREKPLSTGTLSPKETPRSFSQLPPPKA